MIAAAGVASRRVAENLIVEGRVTVNGEVVDALGRRVDPEKDAISVDGVPVQIDSSRRYIVLNKPTGVVSSLQDERGRRDLTEFLDRLGKFDAPPANPGQKNPNYAGLVGRIDGISGLAPRDRLGPKIKAEGFTEAEDLQDDVRYALDIELWEFGTRPRREAKVAEIEQFLIAQGGAVFDTYIGPSITVMRVEATGRSERTPSTVASPL